MDSTVAMLAITPGGCEDKRNTLLAAGLLRPCGRNCELPTWEFLLIGRWLIVITLWH